MSLQRFTYTVYEPTGTIVAPILAQVRLLMFEREGIEQPFQIDFGNGLVEYGDGFNYVLQYFTGTFYTPGGAVADFAAGEVLDFFYTNPTTVIISDPNDILVNDLESLAADDDTEIIYV